LVIDFSCCYKYRPDSIVQGFFRRRIPTSSYAQEYSKGNRGLIYNRINVI
jgi:hypothetical protein